MLQTPAPTGPYQRGTTVEKQHVREISVASWKNNENELKVIKKYKPGNKNNGANNSIPNNEVNNYYNNNPENSNRAERKPKTIHPPNETCGKTNCSTESGSLGANAANSPPASLAQKAGRPETGPRKSQSKCF